MAAIRKSKRVAPTSQWGARLKRLFVLCALVSVLAGTGYLISGQLKQGTHPIRSVRVLGDLQFQDPQQLQQLIEPQIAEGFFHIDVDGLSRSLEALAWIQRASVRRIWPDLLVVTLSEQQPIARWNGTALLNQFGETFAPLQLDLPALLALPELSGPAGTEMVMVQHYRDYMRLVEPYQLRPSRLALNERRAWELGFENGMQLQLGRENMQQRLQRFMQIYARVVEPHLPEIESLDLRYTNGFALKWRSGHQPKV